jgi:cyclic pyranopterin phosphate synthase
MSHKDVLSFEEIIEVVKVGVSMGINKVRITGGEPLVKRGIVDLIRMIAQIEGVEDLAMTTNGTLLNKYAVKLKEAGLNRVNISLDTMNPEKFRTITRLGDIEDVFLGIEAAKNAGLVPVKVNCVVMESSNEEDAKDVAQYCAENDLQIRYIHKMDLRTGEYSIVEGGEGGDCKICNRLRLTANGMIKPCLFSDLEYSIREFGVKRAIELAVDGKPECGTVNNSGQFSNIGG